MVIRSLCFATIKAFRFRAFYFLLCMPNLCNFAFMKISDYRSASQYLYSKHALEMKLGLVHVRNLLKETGHPERHFPAIHIAGTNGKGSTAAMVESILRKAGYKTGLYTSPHLIDMRERIRIRGVPIPQERILRFIQENHQSIESTRVSFFECLTAMAFRHFADERVDAAILETGLGGRLDATNTVKPVLTIITRISLDHTRILGRDVVTIAREKAGILKKGIRCVIGRQHWLVRRFLSEFGAVQHVPMRFVTGTIKGSRIQYREDGTTFHAVTKGHVWNDLHVALPGTHQVENALTALAAIEELRSLDWHIPDTAVYSGLDKVRWPARMDLLHRNPKILLDAAHNPLGARSLARTIRENIRYSKLILLFGVLGDKDYRDMLRVLAPLADHVILTRPLSHRALDPHALAALPVLHGRKVDIITNIQKAWQAALDMAEKDDLVCGVGSIYLVGELLRIWKGRIRSDAN